MATDKSKEAMKLALEALEAKGDAWIVLERKAITALREALAEQPAQQQEPFFYHDGRDIVGKEFAHHSDVFPLYTSPPAQRPWVGLTDEEIIDVLHPLVMADMPDEATDYEIARAIEAKLRSKNT